MSLLKTLGQKLQAGGSFPRYLLVGVFTSLLDLGLFSLFSVVFHIPEVPSNVASTIITICVSYFINRAFVFHSDKVSWASFFSFAGVTLFTGLVLQSFIIWGVVQLEVQLDTGLSRSVVLPTAKVIAMGTAALANYFGYRTIFSRKAD